MTLLGLVSLSARRAWIEIVSFRGPGFCPRVALRKESVDRNHDGMLKYRGAEQSLSARRAWIEINAMLGSSTIINPGRSPQGERG